MKMQRYLATAGVVAGLTIGSAPQARAQETEHPLYKFSDSRAGTEVRIYQPRPDELMWIASDAAVTVKKTASRGRSVTTIETKEDRASVTISPSSVIVERAGTVIVARPGEREQSAAVRRLIERSDALWHGVALLGRITIGQKSPVEHQLRTTRAVLLTMIGNHSGMLAVRALAEPVRAPRVIAAAYQTPTECWEAYAKEAIAAYKEYEDCTDDLAWYEVLDLAACAAIYDMRALGAFAWWLRCVGLGVGDITV